MTRREASFSVRSAACAPTRDRVGQRRRRNRPDQTRALAREPPRPPGASAQFEDVAPSLSGPMRPQRSCYERWVVSTARFNVFEKWATIRSIELGVAINRPAEAKAVVGSYVHSSSPCRRIVELEQPSATARVVDRDRCSAVRWACCSVGEKSFAPGRGRGVNYGSSRLREPEPTRLFPPDRAVGVCPDRCTLPPMYPPPCPTDL